MSDTRSAAIFALSIGVFRPNTVDGPLLPCGHLRGPLLFLFLYGRCSFRFRLDLVRVRSRSRGLYLFGLSIGGSRTFCAS